MRPAAVLPLLFAAGACAANEASPPRGAAPPAPPAPPAKATTAAEATTAAPQPSLVYPGSERQSLVETLFGASVADPYRWLEDDVRESPKVR
jgi:prolyl oligopeptidase